MEPYLTKMGQNLSPHKFSKVQSSNKLTGLRDFVRCSSMFGTAPQGAGGSQEHMKTTTLKFASISRYQPGALSALIHKSYAGLIEECPEYWKQEGKKWDDFDRQSFAHPDTIGKCVFVSCLDDQSIGLASYDPRHEPQYGLIGQNCILPEYRGRGFGKQQILEILGRFRESQTRAVRVTTSEHPFFMAAKKMYQSLGFKETRRFVGGPDPRYKLIELEIELSKAKPGPRREVK